MTICSNTDKGILRGDKFDSQAIKEDFARFYGNKNCGNYLANLFLLNPRI